MPVHQQLQVQLGLAERHPGGQPPGQAPDQPKQVQRLVRGPGVLVPAGKPPDRLDLADPVVGPLRHITSSVHNRSIALPAGG